MSKLACRSILLLYVCLCQSALFAQTLTISGKVQSTSGPVGLATVSLLNPSDSSWLKSVLTSDTGIFVMPVSKAGDYLLNAQALGFETKLIPLKVMSDRNDVNIHLIPVSKTLKEVTITEKRPLIETAPGKLLVNVDQSINASGTNVLDLLKKSPGIQVSASGEINMQGKQGVLILVNDKPTYLSGDELAQYLRGMPSDQVSQLELITQPSARYDAEGNAGVINIKTKQQKKKGLNGNASASFTQGTYPIYSASFFLNYHVGKVNLWINSNYHLGKYFLTNSFERTFRDRNSFAETGKMSSYMYLWEAPTGGDLNSGCDHQLTEKTSLGLLLKTNYNPVPYGSATDAVFYDQTTGTFIYNHADFYADQLRKRAIASLYLKHRFSDLHELNVSVDYLKYWMRSYPQLVNRDTDESGSELPGLTLRGYLPTDIDVYSFRIDHSISKDKFKIESGVKSSLVTTVTAASYDVLQNGVWVYDTTRSNHFSYLENISAFYANASYDLNKKLSMQAGLRAEHTFARGEQQVNNQTFVRNYLSLFPTGYLLYKADSNNQWELNYGRRIQRPEYRSLNPFIKFVSKYVYDVGNPLLQPQFSDNIEFKHSFRNVLFSSLGYSHIAGIRQNNMVVDDQTKIAYTRPENIGSNDLVNLSIEYSSELTTKWQFSAGANAYYTLYRGILNGRNIRVEGTGFSCNVNSQFSFNRGWTAEFHADYSPLSREALLWMSGGWFYTEAGVSKKLLKDKMRITFSTQDPFRITAAQVKVNYNELQSSSVMKFYTQQFRIGISYTFGQSEQGKQRSSSGISDESERIK